MWCVCVRGVGGVCGCVGCVGCGAWGVSGVWGVGSLLLRLRHLRLRYQRIAGGGVLPKAESLAAPRGTNLMNSSETLKKTTVSLRKWQQSERAPEEYKLFHLLPFLFFTCACNGIKYWPSIICCIFVRGRARGRRGEGRGSLRGGGFLLNAGGLATPRGTNLVDIHIYSPSVRNSPRVSPRSETLKKTRVSLRNRYTSKGARGAHI